MAPQTVLAGAFDPGDPVRYYRTLASNLREHLVARQRRPVVEPDRIDPVEAAVVMQDDRIQRAGKTAGNPLAPILNCLLHVHTRRRLEMIGAGTAPGAMALTRTPRGAISMASCRVKATIAPRVPAYTECSVYPS